MTAPAVTAPATAPQPEPYDITLNASDLAPGQQDQVAELAEKLPEAVISLRAPPHQLPPAGREGDEAPPVATPDEAAFQASVARNLAAQGDLRQALRFQHRAAELDPDNILYRFSLAILYDRVGDAEAAAMLYRQVVDAYRAGDSILPKSISIDDIRRRLDYLDPG
jgi:tetratricopeptide (TPR) repeat protein